MKTKILLLVVMAVFVASCTKKKEVRSGNMIVEIPTIYEVEKEALNQISDFMSGIIAGDKKLSHVYIFLEIKMKSAPEYLMGYSVKSAIENATKQAQWGEVEKTKFQSYDACKCNFTANFQGRDMNGIAYAFNDGKSRSYGVVALYKGTIPSEDPVLNSFHLAANTDPEATFKDAGEEMQHFVEQLRPIFGHSTGNGFTLHNIEVYPEKKEVVYTMGINLLSKSDLTPFELAEVQTDLKSNMPEAIKEMAANQPPLLRCMEEEYNITIKLLDMDEEHLFTLTLSPKDYQ